MLPELSAVPRESPSRAAMHRSVPTIAFTFVVGLAIASCANGVTEVFDDDDGGGGGGSGGAGTGGSPVCGDASCSPAESCTDCPDDCACSSCGDAVCDASEDCQSCAADCGECTASCGNGMCEGSEDCATCPADCGNCTPMCGDGSCDAGETCSACPSDCGACPPVCGDAVCEGTENQGNCPQDCGSTCAHSPCLEGVALDPNCDPCVTTVCFQDDFCCSTLWDEFCVDAALTFCTC